MGKNIVGLEERLYIPERALPEAYRKPARSVSRGPSD